MTAEVSVSELLMLIGEKEVRIMVLEREKKSLLDELQAGQLSKANASQTLKDGVVSRDA